MGDSFIDTITKDTLTKIHNDVYKKVNKNSIDIFLCGRASKGKQLSIRDLVRKELDKKRNIRILYPEDLFMDMLYKDKDCDLLSLESFLADNCDIICIICESAGSLVELGAFTNNDKTVNKVVAVVEDSYRRKKSFVMLGPIKLIQKRHKNNVIFYTKNKVNELNKQLDNTFKRNKMNKLITMKDSDTRDINTIIGLYFFIPLLLYFYNKMEYGKLTNYIKFLYEKNSFDVSNLDRVLNSSLKLLHKDMYIQKSTIEEKSYYTLTGKGYINVGDVKKSVYIKNKYKLYDSIRFGIISGKYYKQQPSP